jgi:hypothetical protein
MNPASGEHSSITLRALDGQPLDDDRIRDMVIATAHALAERHGLVVLHVETEPDRATFTLSAGRIEALGFAAELRRLTTRWYTQKYGERTLWGEATD